MTAPVPAFVDAVGGRGAKPIPPSGVDLPV